MTALNTEMTVGQLVAEKPSRSRVFEKLKIDYCCGGKKTLVDTCAKKNLDPEQVLKEIALSDEQSNSTSEYDPRSEKLSDLIDNILENHHAFLRRELPRLHQMIEKVTRVHGDKDARFAEILEIYGAMREELEMHMPKEENVLFPAIRLLESSSELPQLPFPSIAFPIQAMEHEHDTVGNALEQFRQLTDDYTPPDWACNTYRATLDGLHEMETDLHTHIHKENNVLFPRALSLETQLTV